MTVVNGESAGEKQQQQQQGSAPDLCTRYNAIGIPEVKAAAMFKRSTTAPQQQTAIYDFED